MKSVNISLTKEQYQMVNKLTKNLGFANRSEFFRALLRYLPQGDQQTRFNLAMRQTQNAFKNFLEKEGYDPEKLSEKKAQQILKKELAS